MQNNTQNNRKKVLSDLEIAIQTLQKRFESEKDKQQIKILLKKLEEEKKRVEEEDKDKEINFPFWQLLGIYGGLSGGLDSALGGIAIGSVIDLGLKYSDGIKGFTRSIIDIKTFVNSSLNLIGRINKSEE